MARHEMTDWQWEQIKEMLPSNGGRGRQWQDHRRIMNGIFWILNTGAPWRDLPERYGKWKTVHDRFRRWSRDGIFDKILERLQIRLDENGYIDWDLWCIDGSSVRAHKSAAGGLKKGGQTENPKTTHWVAQEAASQPRFTWCVTATEFPSLSK